MTSPKSDSFNIDQLLGVFFMCFKEYSLFLNNKRAIVTF